MHSFEDKTGQSWNVELTVGIIENVKDRLEIDLFDPVGDDTQLIAKLAPISTTNIKLFIDMIWVVCEEQCNERELSSAQFGGLLNAESLKGIYTAFYEEWELFFQSLGRKDLGEIIKKMNSLIQEGVAEVIAEVEKMTFQDLKSQITENEKSPTTKPAMS